MALPLIQSRQHDQVMSRDQLLRLFFVTDGKDGVIGLEHGLRHRRQELCSAMLMFLKADENSAKTVEQLRLRDRLTNQRRAARNLQTVPLIGEAIRSEQVVGTRLPRPSLVGRRLLAQHIASGHQHKDDGGGEHGDTKGRPAEEAERGEAARP